MRFLQNGEPGAVAAAGGVAVFLVTAVPGHPGGGCRAEARPRRAVLSLAAGSSRSCPGPTRLRAWAL